MEDGIEIFVGDVNNVEARVYARCAAAYRDQSAAAERIVMRGTLRGPYCQGSRTLPAVIAFREVGQPGLIEALIPDPCTWSPELPHLYHADVEARQGNRVLAEYHGTIGLRQGQHG